MYYKRGSQMLRVYRPKGTNSADSMYPALVITLADLSGLFLQYLIVTHTMIQEACLLSRCLAMDGRSDSDIPAFSQHVTILILRGKRLSLNECIFSLLMRIKKNPCNFGTQDIMHLKTITDLQSILGYLFCFASVFLSSFERKMPQYVWTNRS
jgi:hypothetical protein